MPRSLRLDGDSVHACIENSARRDPDGPCVGLLQANNWKTFTRAEFWHEVERYTHLFRSSLKTSSLVLFIKKPDLDLLAGYIGAMRAGHLPAQISYPSSKVGPAEYRRKVSHILTLTGARCVFTDIEAGSSFESLEGLTILTPGNLTTDKAGTVANHEALVQFSSGSTGLQKGVVLTHRAIIAHMRHYGEALGVNDQDVLVSWLPLYHDMGLIACYLMPLMWGIPFYQMDPFDWLSNPDLLLETIEVRQGTLCFLPNFAYHVLVNKSKDHDLAGMRLFVNCSEPALDETHQAFKEKFSSVAPGALGVCYALAESTFAVSQTAPGIEPERKFLEGRRVMSCGKVLSGVQIRILEPNSEGVGEIAIQGDHLFDRYLAEAAPLEDDFYPTGDLGLVSDAGEIFVTGRKKDLIIVNGKNIYPHDVENACSAVEGIHPGRVVAFGLTHHDLGSEELYVLAESDGGLPEFKIKIAAQKAVEAEIGVVPRRVELYPAGSLVKTSSGKISRSRNKELYREGKLGAGATI